MGTAHYDLAIVGAGSGNSIPGPDFDHWSIAMVQDGPFGGTCLNAGCIPTKMFVYPADLAAHTREATELNVDLRLAGVDWKSLRDRVFGRIDPIAADGQQYRLTGSKNLTTYLGHGRFTGNRQLQVGDDVITADRWVLAAGSRPAIPTIAGLDTVAVHTSDTIMRLDELPARMMILGSGYIAAEFAHVFSSFGTKVTVVARSNMLLRKMDVDLATTFTASAKSRYEVLTEAAIASVKPCDDGIRVDMADGQVHDVDVLMIAVGREPNGDLLGLEHTGVRRDDAGRVIVDQFQRTTAPDIYALGDISSHYPLKHVANHEARVVAHNLAHPDALLAADHRYVPSAVFALPQIGSVGLTEQQCRQRGLDVRIARHRYADTAAGWAREDTDGFCKLIAEGDRLIGAHILGPEAAVLVQLLIQAMSFELPLSELARGQYWIHPALSELVENTLLKLM